MASTTETTLATEPSLSATSLPLTETTLSMASLSLAAPVPQKLMKSSTQDSQASVDSLASISTVASFLDDDESDSRPPLRSNVYVGNLPLDFTTQNLLDLFSSFGSIFRCKVGNIRAGKTSGYGFVQFHEEESALKAIAALNGFTVQDKTLSVSVASGKGKVRPKTNVYFSGLPLSYATSDLVAMCERFGRIIGSRVLVNPITNVSRGYGFVRFDTHENANKCIAALNGTTPEKGVEPLIVKFARDPTDPKHPSQRKMTRGFYPTDMPYDLDSGSRSRSGGDSEDQRIWLMPVPAVTEMIPQAEPVYSPYLGLPDSAPTPEPIYTPPHYFAGYGSYYGSVPQVSVPPVPIPQVPIPQVSMPPPPVTYLPEPARVSKPIYLGPVYALSPVVTKSTEKGQKATVTKT